MKGRIQLMNDGSERVPYNIAEYRAYASSGSQNDSVISHWHDDLEFIYVESGALLYSVNGREIPINAGEGIFANSRSIHGHHPATEEGSVYTCVLIHPDFLSTNDAIRRRYIDPVIHNPGMPYVLLSYGDERTQPVLTSMERIVHANRQQDETIGLILMYSGFLMLDCLYRYMVSAAQQAAYADPRMEALHDMIGFVQSHYAGDVSLNDIATAGRVSKSSCCAIFREYLHQTPVGYLTGYRLERGAELLRNTNLTITEVAMRTGFASQSYFTETFRKHNGITPSDYRKERAR